MKKFNKLTVKSVMDLLIHTNGQTTTLEIKHHLRELGFHANQDDVHSTVEEIFNEEVIEDDLNFDDDTAKYTRSTVNSKYNVYKFSDEFLEHAPDYTPATDGSVVASATMSGTGHVSKDTSAIKTAVPFTTKNTTLSTPTAKDLNDGAPSPLVNSNPALLTTPSREPILIFYTENHARKSGAAPTKWIAYHKDGNNEIHIYDEKLTRDQVRSKYASIMKMKIQDVRSCKFSNY